MGQVGAQQGLNATNQLAAQSNQAAGIAGIGAQQSQMANNQLTTRLNQGAQQANIGNQQQTAALNLYGAQNTMGTQQQTQDQNLISNAQQNYTNQQQYNMNQALAASAVLHGTPYATPTTASTYQAAPNTVGQLTGLGIAGVSAYNASQATPTK